jgi:hypothetical protein
MFFSEPSRVFLVQFVVQFIHFLARLLQRTFAGRRDFVNSAAPPSRALQARLEQAGALQPVHQRVQRTWSNMVAMVVKLMHHGQAKHRPLGRMQQHMEPNQPIE